MAFPRGPIRTPAPARVRVAVYAVGQRVYVAGAGDRPARVTLTDDADITPLASLNDGTEVAIVAWRPNRAGTTRYCVRATDSGLEGWLAVGSLRSTPKAVAPAPAAPAGTVPPRVREVEDSGRRFGQRRG